MKPLETVYWLRFALGILAAVVCVGYVAAVYGLPFRPDWPFNIFLNSMSIAIVVYLLTYYMIKSRYGLKVVKTQKLFTTGIGIYFMSWIAFYALLYTTLTVA